MIALGDKVKDTMTGFIGIVAGITKWKTGCDTAVVQPPVDKDGKHQDSKAFDVTALTVVQAAKPKVSRPKSALGAG